MNREANDPNAIPCMVLTFTDDELAIVKEVLEAEGYGDDLKTWVLDNMMKGEGESRYDGAADRVINNLREFVNDNPQTIEAAGRFANGVVGSFLNRMKQKGGPQ